MSRMFGLLGIGVLLLGTVFYYREQGTRLGTLPVTEQLVKGLITLPMYPSMMEADQDWVVHCLKTALRKAEVECG